MLKLRKNKKGFTLVELIVVIAIMAVLAGTVAGVTVSQLNKSKNDNAASDIKNLFNEFETFLASNPDLVDAISAESQTNKQLEKAQALVTEFNKEKMASKGITTNILVLKTADQAAGIKAGAGQYAYAVTYTPAQPATTGENPKPAEPAKLALTIWCDKVGSTGANPSGTRTYEI